MAHDPQGVHPPSRRTSLERPSLEYQYVFDQCAVAAHRLEDPVVVLAASPFHARELLTRLDDCPARLAPAGGWSPTTADLDRMREGEGARFEVWPEDSDVSARMVLWAEPEQGRVEQVFEQLESMMAPGGALYIIARGPAARFLPEARSVALPAAGTRRVLATLRRRGYTVEAQYGYHGLASMAWGYAYRLLDRLGRKGLADRCFYAGRARYVVSGGGAWWAPVRLIVARKGRPKALPPRASLAASGSSSHG